MERGRTFYLTLASGLVALVLLLVSVNLPAQLVFESKPYALVVLKSGNLDGWSAEQLGLSSAQLDMVKNNYEEFLSKHKTDDDSDDSDDSSDEDEEDEEDEHDDDGHKTGNSTMKGSDLDESSSSSSSSSDDTSDEDGESSDSVVMTLEEKLQDKPVLQTVGIGLFHGKICTVMKNSRERCQTISTNEAIYSENREVSFMMNDINMPMWNNLRVESLFSVIACALGLLCLIASLRPCCHNKRLPTYLGSVSFLASGVLVFLPIVRILLVSADFEQNLAYDLNVTTKLLTSWSLVASGIGAAFALIASFTLIATKWYKVTKKMYHVLKSNSEIPGHVPNGDAVKIKMSDLQEKEKMPMAENQSDIYQNIEEKSELLEENDGKNNI